MVDIEEVEKELDNDRPVRQNEGLVNIHYRASKSQDESLLELKQEAKASDVPGTQKVWLKTYGCSHNTSDSEYMEGLLTRYGYEMVTDSSQADVWLVNSCTVKDPSQAAFMNVVNQAKNMNKPIVVAGCVSQADRNLKGLEDVSILGITQIDRVVEAVEQTLQGHTIKLLAKKNLPLLDLPKIRKNPLVEIIPLSTGCLGSCTYCKTKQARGKLGSYAKESLVNRARQVIWEGVSELWLSSEDTGAYGLDIGTNIAELLLEMIDVIPVDSGVMLRIGMTNPPYMLAHLEVIAKILNHPNVYAFLHIPVQAGSNSVLDAMNREYTVEQFETIVDYLYTHVPDMTIATDIICGFPNETEEDFEKTLNLIKKYRFGIVNISQFYPRPGTVAAKMKRLPTQMVKNRSRQLTTLFESFTPYSQLLGRQFLVYFNIEISEDKQHSVGHNKAYVKVLVPYDPSLPGTCYMVEVLSVHRFHVVAKIISEKIYDVSRNISQPINKKKASSKMIYANDDNDNENEADGKVVEGLCGNGEDCCGGNGDCGKDSSLLIPPETEESSEEIVKDMQYAMVWAGVAVAALTGGLLLAWITARRRK
eukprot:gene8842-9749_t